MSRYLSRKLAVVSDQNVNTPTLVMGIVELKPSSQLTVTSQGGQKAPLNVYNKSFYGKPQRALPKLKLHTQTNHSFRIGQISDSLGFISTNSITLIGCGKGHGFSGVVSRYGFGRGPMTRGSNHHRAPGSAGAGTFPSRVFPRKRMPGRWGNYKKTYRQVPAPYADIQYGLLWVKGSIPGKKGNLLEVQPL